MSSKLVIVQPAEVDVDEIYRYIYERSPNGATNWYRAFRDCLTRIAERPLSCSLALENDAFSVELRQAMFKTRYGDPYRCVLAILNDGFESCVSAVEGRQT